MLYVNTAKSFLLVCPDDSEASDGRLTEELIIHSFIQNVLSIYEEPTHTMVNKMQTCRSVRATPCLVIDELFTTFRKQIYRKDSHHREASCPEENLDEVWEQRLVQIKEPV